MILKKLTLTPPIFLSNRWILSFSLCFLMGDRLVATGALTILQEFTDKQGLAL